MINKEIERKFLVSQVPESDLVDGVLFRQGYIVTNNKVLVQVSVSDNKGHFTIESGKKDRGGQYFSYPIPIDQAYLMIEQLTDSEDKEHGYLHTADDISIRIRVADDQAFLTIKGPRIGLSCLEVEFAIPMIDGVSILDSVADAKQIHKVRYTKMFNDFAFELDVFDLNNKGLILVEVELEDENIQVDAYPEGWVMKEVADKKYSNSYLALHPYFKWEDKPKCLIVS
ncbi:MAG: CYTH domain-containing protein [Oceanisphaera sp.]|uniref:CYTH domain-containing protein n=1 Tax=Oceanisphaera sp. TaxID=1929979 RepID=UPI003F99062F